MNSFQISHFIPEVLDLGMSSSLSNYLQDLTQQAKIDWEQKEEVRLQNAANPSGSVCLKLSTRSYVRHQASRCLPIPSLMTLTVLPLRTRLRVPLSLALPWTIQ